jgi:hypothetical protein
LKKNKEVEKEVLLIQSIFVKVIREYNDDAIKTTDVGPHHLAVNNYKTSKPEPYYFRRLKQWLRITFSNWGKNCKTG